ncbi:MAG: hypothetical protein JOZ00_20180, partial [Mycobacterium sp.]|uniref:hypothetical protein n=1 Tax=Mycobacterium sp. TaxID=1785 RepID=UPI001ED124C3
TTTVAGGPGGLFPFATSLNPAGYTNNYQFWAGTCRGEEPPAGTDAASVTPGFNGPVNVIQPEIDVNATYKPQTGSTQAVTPADVKIIFNTTSGSACSDTWGPYASTSFNPDPSHGALHFWFAAPFAASATQSPASASGQTGSIKVCADYNPGGGGTYYKATSSLAYTDQYGADTSIATIPILWTSTASGKC